MPKFKLLAGKHTALDGTRYTAEAGKNIVEDEHPLDVIFPNKFKRLVGAKKKNVNPEEAPLDDPNDPEMIRHHATAGLPEEVQGEFLEGGMRREPTPEDADLFDEGGEAKAAKADDVKGKPEHATTRKGVKSRTVEEAEAEEKGEEEGEEKSGERDATDKFEAAGQNDYKVVQVRGEGYYVMDGKKRLNKEGMNKRQTEKYLDDLVGGE